MCLFQLWPCGLAHSAGQPTPRVWHALCWTSAALPAADALAHLLWPRCRDAAAPVVLPGVLLIVVPVTPSPACSFPFKCFTSV